MNKYELDVTVRINKLSPEGYRTQRWPLAEYRGSVKAEDFLAAINVLAQFEKLAETFKAADQ